MTIRISSEGQLQITCAAMYPAVIFLTSMAKIV